MYKIGVVGDYDSICGFSALGLDTYPVCDLEEAEEILKKLTSGGYGIIYVVEDFIEKMPQIFEKFKSMQTPAIIPIPSCKGSTGFGIGNVRKYVEQAVGSDIIFNEE